MSAMTTMQTMSRSSHATCMHT